MKKIKYFLGSETYDCTTIYNMEISKKQFTIQLKELTKESKKTKEEEYESPLEILNKTINEKKEFIETIYWFKCAGTITYLTKIECKDNYHFK